ncbi:hypothetical protein PHJA_002215200 [Phtheirospermum japonicum]|uniref:Uncharacterized protein n=1 Tax=Phtheirospermum japonicum TaxID=374723 RepID=A0A830CR87_9LAMI|nr:hypothetical protein PHJA_002215200 [Phtheirospermum japonicum]
MAKVRVELVEGLIIHVAMDIAGMREETMCLSSHQLLAVILATLRISVLALRIPKLKTYINCDLTASSWISVAWYPIYRIPVGPTLQNVDAYFLTFHSLAKPNRSGERMRDANSKLSLPTFGLVSYKFKISDLNGVFEGQKVNSLLRAADNWLRLLQVNHPDYNFFMTNNTY